MCLSNETRQAIVAWMTKRKIKRVELARRLGMNRSQVTNILNGHETVSMAMADRIVQALGCKILVKLEDKK